MLRMGTRFTRSAGSEHPRYISSGQAGANNQPEDDCLRLRSVLISKRANKQLPLDDDALGVLVNAPNRYNNDKQGEQGPNGQVRRVSGGCREMVEGIV